MRYKVNGIEISFEESNLSNWFELTNEGYRCKCSFQYKYETVGSDDDSNYDVEEVEVLAKSDVQDYLASQAVIEIVGATTKFEQNDFGPVMRMVYGAITKNITPKHHTQHKMVERDLEMMYHILKGYKVNFPFLIMDWTMEKAVILHSLATRIHDSKRRPVSLMVQSLWISLSSLRLICQT